MVNALDHGILDSIASLPVPPDLLNKLRIRLETLLPGTSCPATVLDRLGRFVAAARSPTSLLAFFDRDATTLDSLLRLLGTGEKIADRLIADPESFDLIRASGGAATPREVLVDELAAELEALGRCGADQAALASLVRSVVDRERLRIAYAEFVAGVPTAAIAADLTVLAEAVIEAAVQFSLLGLTRRYGWPRTPSGEAGRIAVIGLGPLGSRELG
ncbi:MAG: glutamate-ammonia-ligase adenylyltransferase, partial [Planctomycetaceae bacterium]